MIRADGDGLNGMIWSPLSLVENDVSIFSFKIAFHFVKSLEKRLF